MTVTRTSTRRLKLPIIARLAALAAAVTLGLSAMHGPARAQTSAPSDLPVVSINDYAALEGTGGTPPGPVFIFEVRLSKPALTTVDVPVRIQHGTATPSSTLTWDPWDFVDGEGVVRFAPGETVKQIGVQVLADARQEADETFSVNLGTPVGASLGRARGEGRIRNDDFPRLQIGDVAITEGNSGQKTMQFAVTLSEKPLSAVTVNYATSSGSAGSGSDYLARSGQLSFAAGTTVLSKTISVPIVGDILQEADETLFVTLSGAVNATILDGVGKGTILNDDFPPPSDCPPLTPDCQV